MYSKLEPQVIKEYTKKYNDLPPAKNWVARIEYAVKEENFPIEFFIQTSKVEYEDLSEMTIDTDIKTKLFECMRDFGVIEDDRDYSEIISTLEQEKQEEKLSKIASDLEIGESDEAKIKRLEQKITSLMAEKNDLAEDLTDTAEELHRAESNYEIVMSKYKEANEKIKELEQALENEGGNLKSTDAVVNELNSKLQASKELLNEKESELNILKDKLEEAQNKVNLSEDIKNKAINIEREKYEKIIEEYKSELKNAGGSSSVGEVDKYKEVSRARLSGYKILGIYGGTKSFIKSLINLDDNVAILDEPVECDLALVTTLPTSKSVRETKELLEQLDKTHTIKIINLWSNKLSFNPDTLLGERVDLIIKYDDELFVESLLKEEEQMSALVDNEIVHKLNSLIKTKI